MKSRHWIAPVLFIAFIVLAFPSAAPVQAAAKYKGQEEFRTYCKTCHAENSPNGEYTPMTLIQAQWERFFEKKYVRAHEGLTNPEMGDKPVLELITPELLEQIREFAIEHAADSGQPMTCG